MSKNASAAESRVKKSEDAISASEANSLFRHFKPIPSLVIAVSGGPDSVALLWLVARWRRTLKNGPRLVAVTVDHGLRAESTREALAVKRLAAQLNVDHRTVRWAGEKPRTGLPAAARDARYRLLAKAATAVGAAYIMTAHTCDDQAETVLMRLARGSGLAGLAAMAAASRRDGLTLLRPLLGVPKARLVATLQKAKVAYADDPTNHDPAYARPRLRALLPALAAEGADARGLSRLALRLRRAHDALDLMTDGAEHYLRNLNQRHMDAGWDAAAFAALSEEIRIRLLLRAIRRSGHEGQPELGKVEALSQKLDQATSSARLPSHSAALKQTLAGAVISLGKGRLTVAPAPHRRKKTGKLLPRP